MTTVPSLPLKDDPKTDLYFKKYNYKLTIRTRANTLVRNIRFAKRGGGTVTTRKTLVKKGDVWVEDDGTIGLPLAKELVKFYNEALQKDCHFRQEQACISVMSNDLAFLETIQNYKILGEFDCDIKFTQAKVSPYGILYRKQKPKYKFKIESVSLGKQDLTELMDFLNYCKDNPDIITDYHSSKFKYVYSRCRNLLANQTTSVSVGYRYIGTISLHLNDELMVSSLALEYGNFIDKIWQLELMPKDGSS